MARPESHRASVPTASTMRDRRINLDNGDDRQLDVVIDRFVMVEGNLLAFATGVLLGRGFFVLQ